uniref:Transcription factor 7-like 1-B n=1 Tax=Oreochromis niloticus TaxID=8128 RepID=A0A669AWH3_ORENI
MDIREENNHISETMQSEEAPSTSEDAAVDILGQTSYPLPPPPFPTGIPAPPQPASDPQTGGFVSNILPEPAPPVHQQLVPLMGSGPAHLYSQPATDRQGQLRHPKLNVVGIPDNMRQYVHPVGELHDVPLWDFVTPPPPSNPQLPPPFPTGAPTQSALDPWTGRFLSHTLLEPAPPVSQQLVPLILTNTATVPAHLYSQPGTDRQGQLRHPEHNVVGIPDNMRQYVHPVGELHDVPVRDFVVPAPPSNISTPKKRKCEARQYEDRLYIKKPPNAFMLYLKEQRPKVMAELNTTGSAAINAVVGKRWRSLSKDQQAKYFDQAETESCRHATEHPDWSTKENYGKKRKRTRNRTSSTASASEPKQEAQQAKRLCVTPAQTQPSSSYSVVKEPLKQPQRQPTVTNLPHQQSACVQLQNTQTTADAPVCQVNPVLPASHMDFSASASLASSAPVQLQKEAPFVSDTNEALLSVVEQLDPLLTSEQFQQPSSPLIGPQLSQTSLASPVYCALSTLYASPDTFFKNQKEPIGFADIQHDIWPILPVTPQPDTLSCSNTPKYSPISPFSLENSSPSKLLDSFVAPTECQPMSPVFSETAKYMMSLLNDLEPGPFAQHLQPSSPQAGWSSPESDQSCRPPNHSFLQTLY